MFQKLTSGETLIPVGLLACGAAAFAQSSATATYDDRGPRVSTSGHATAISGRFTEDGFEGVLSGPEGTHRIGSGPSSRSRTKHYPNGVTVFEGPGALLVEDGFGPRPSVAFGPGGSVFVDVPGVHVGVPAAATAVPTPREIGRMIRAERYDDAVELADAALRRDRHDAECLQLRALAAFLDGDYRDAAYDVVDVLETDEPFDWDRIDSLADAGDYTAALRDLQERAADESDRADLQMLLAYHGLVLGDVPAACEHLRNVLELEPRDPLALELLDRYDPQPRTQPPRLGDPIGG